ncbi:MAG: copper homeostasis protein CutC, partial [Planctomycetota bacterium]
MKYNLEVGARTVDDALAAERGGADRVELYCSPLEGALTPAAGLIKAAAEAITTLKLFAMIRPRAGDFLYSEKEFETMQRDTEIAVEMGIDGIMCGILKPNGDLDVKRMADIKKRSGSCCFTLHRAFDFTRDPFQTLEEAIDLGCNYVLSLGQEQGATFGKDTLLKIIEKADKRTNVMIALGDDFDTTADLENTVKELGAADYHIVNGYRKCDTEMEYTGSDMIGSDHLKKTIFERDYLCEKSVREARDILDS